MRVVQQLVFTGTGRWKLACGPVLVEAANGDLLCAWLSGGDGEPARDNCVLLSRSTDRGRTWEEAQVFLPAGEQASALTSWFLIADGRIVAFAASWPAEKGYTEWFYSRRVSADHGRTWSEPEPISLHQNRACLHRSIMMSNGERLFLGSIFDPRSRPLTGPIPELLKARSESEAAAVPAVEGEVGPGKFGTHRHGCCVFVNPDGEGREFIEYGCIANRPLGLLEPTVAEIGEGHLVMLMRAEWGGFLWRAESFDYGRTWMEAWETNIPNPTSLASLVRLSSGRIALIHNATGQKGIFGTRNPLSIWVSDDGLRTWTLQKDVLATADSYRPASWGAGADQLAYPEASVVDGRLVFVYDRNRRDVLFVETDLT